MSDFENRLKKNARARFSWAKRAGLTAFRVYDNDMPEWPYAVDWYDGSVHVSEYTPRRRRDSIDSLRVEVRRAVAAVLAVEPSRVFLKTHEPKAWGKEQYERVAQESTTVIVTENGLRFECNLSDYLDTGLFLDHRLTRARVRSESAGKRVLNLFAYTGSFTVYAQAGGAKETTTVDLSNTYCDVAGRNFELNGFHEGDAHRIVRADVLAWLERARGEFDVIVLDPPSFSTSKKMGRRFEVQRDHAWLVEQAQGLLAPGGALYFSTNFQHFELDRRLHAEEELTPKSIPEDFRDLPHRCWRFTAAARERR